MCVAALILCRDKKTHPQVCDKDASKEKGQALAAIGLPYVGNVELKWIWIRVMSAVCGTVPLLGRQK